MDPAREALNPPSVEMNRFPSQSKADASNEVGHLSRTASSSPSKQTIWHKIYHFDWLWECFCWLLGAAALATLAGIIANARNKSAATWRHQHANLSINAVVAVLSAVLKGTCMLIVAEVIGETKWYWFRRARRLKDFERIDDASRGPFGSAKLICQLRAPILALLGAFITIIALAVDPFAQNILALKTCQIASENQTAWVPTADLYNNFFSSMPRNANPAPGDFTLFGIDRYVADPAIKASVYGGLYGSTTSVLNASSIRPFCPGANCTFPRYTSLGICHRCADISSAVERTCVISPPAASDVFSPPCRYALPNGQFLQSYPTTNDYFKWSNGTMQDFFVKWATVNSTSSTVSIPQTPGTFSNVSILANVTKNPRCTIDTGDNCGDVMGVPTMELETVAVECSLFPCARTYETKAANGFIIEIEVKRSFGQGSWLSDHGEFRQALLPDDIEIDPDENCTSRWPYREGSPPACTYVFGSLATMSLGNYFWSFWNGTMSGRTWGLSSSSTDALDILLGLGVTNLTHIDRVIGGIADSMTAAIRLTGRVEETNLVGQGGGQGNVTGQVFVTDTCVEVRWAWIALPVAVCCLTLALLFWTILLNTLQRDHSAWKSSALPILLHGFNAQEMVAKGRLAAMNDMESEAKTTWAKLDTTADGAVFLGSCLPKRAKDQKGARLSCTDS